MTQRHEPPHALEQVGLGRRERVQHLGAQSAAPLDGRDRESFAGGILEPRLHQAQPAREAGRATARSSGIHHASSSDPPLSSVAPTGSTSTRGGPPGGV